MLLFLYGLAQPFSNDLAIIKELIICHVVIIRPLGPRGACAAPRRKWTKKRPSESDDPDGLKNWRLPTFPLGIAVS